MTELTPERWRRVQAILERAVELSEGARCDYLDEACGDDTALRREVESLLAVERGVDAFLAQPPCGRVVLDGDDHVEIDRYRIVRRLGAGGMGVVYLAERADDAFRQQVAVKVLKRGLDTDDFVRRFRVERQALADLQHANIARLIDGGATADGRPYLVIERVEGVPIDRYCDEHGLGVRERIALFARVCDAVAHAHRSLIVHRDLKPGNVLVDGAGEPKLLDFGVAKVLDPETAGSSRAVTATGHRLMTPRYASPEQVRGEPVTTATDVYALGVMLYELLSGRPPYDVDTGGTAELERRICEEEPRRPSAVHDAPDGTRAGSGTRTRRLGRALRGDVDTIVLKALRKEPERRYPTVDELAADLRRFLADEPIAARPPSRRYRFASFVRRNRSALWATGGGVALGLVGAVALLVALVLMPRWSAAARREAHAILVGPDQQAAIYDAVFFRGRPSAETRDGQDEQRDLAMLERAERRYRRGARLNPLDAAIRRELDIVRAARRLRRLDADGAVPPAILELVGADVAELLRADDLDTALQDAAPSARRDAGLVLLLARPGSEGVRALRAYEAVANPDPLIEGLLGQLYLALGHAELAYPRIRAAYEVYPRSRGMTLALAEAAGAVGDHERALRLVEEASELPDADPFDRAARVRAVVLASAGRTDTARDAFEHATRVISHDGAAGSGAANPVACFDFGRFLEAQGDTEHALRRYAEAARIGRTDAPRWAAVPLEAYVDLLERWVAGWSAAERAAHLAARDAAPPDESAEARHGAYVPAPFGLRDKLRWYVEARRELRRRPPRIAIDPEEATRFATERRGWSEPTDASRLAEELAVRPE